MILFLKLAWRNVFRNKRRTIIAGSAIGIGLASLIFVDALILGMKQNMIRTATSSYLGEGQIHLKNYRQILSAEMTINDSGKIIRNLKKEPSVKYFSERVVAFGMINSANDSSAVNITGIDPLTEKDVSQIDDVLVKGTYFAESKPNEILVGSKLAETLEISIGDKVVLTAGQAKSGSLSQDMFRVSGIFRFGVNEMDGGMVFIRIEKAQKMLAIGKNVHEIAIVFKDKNIYEDENLSFRKKYSENGNEADGWETLLPELKAALELSDLSTAITGVILFSIVALIIINTMFMSIYERMFEFGVLKAVGTRPFELGQLIIFESGALAALSIAFGIVLGFAVTYITAKYGINYTGIEFAGVTFRELLYPVMTVEQFIKYPVYVFIFTIIAGLYPALYAAKMSAVDAMRRSM